MSDDLLERLRWRYAEEQDPALKQMLAERIIELCGELCGEQQGEQQGAELSEQSVEPDPPGKVREAYKLVRDELEEIYVALRDMLGAGPKFRQRWDAARQRLLKEKGWTDESFYAEMDRRRWDSRRVS